MNKRSFYYVFICSLLSACSSLSEISDQSNETNNTVDSRTDLTLQPKEIVNPLFSSINTKVKKREKDHAAILAMQGEYAVNFKFHETVILDDGYERYPGKETGAYETVIVVKDTPDQIILQHILVIDDHVIKHWRQDWIYNAKTRFEFVSDQLWEKREIPKEKQRGYWTQCVYEVSDAPRYCGTGKWNHKYGVSTWTSDRTWRPLPRREYTTRDDYNALNVENRHTVTSQGWTHEQDNTKVLRSGRDTIKTIVRESGFNEYRNIQNYDFSSGYTYWEHTRSFWTEMRSRWNQHLQNNRLTKLETPVDGMPIIEASFTLADQIISNNKHPSSKEIDNIFDQWVSHPRN